MSDVQETPPPEGHGLSCIQQRPTEDWSWNTGYGYAMGLFWLVMPLLIALLIMKITK